MFGAAPIRQKRAFFTGYKRLVAGLPATNGTASDLPGAWLSARLRFGDAHRRRAALPSVCT